MIVHGVGKDYMSDIVEQRYTWLETFEEIR